VVVKIQWSPSAIEDVEQIAAYISRDSNYYARSVVRQIIERTRTLSTFPKQGRVVPEIQQSSIRELLVYRYRIIYEVLDESTVLILSIIHAARDM
jgi:addiction module RelE/StbE family toxin